MTEPPTARDRDATAARILAAATDLIAETGLPGFGVNAVARRAGCDKQLIYRYFGGLEGLVEQLGAQLARDIADGVNRRLADQTAQSYGALIADILAAYLDVMRAHPALRRIEAWEAAAPGPLAASLAEGRSRVLQAALTSRRGDLRPPPECDAPALNAALFAAAARLAMAQDSFAGMALQSESDWTRARAALTTLARAAYPSD